MIINYRYKYTDLKSFFLKQMLKIQFIVLSKTSLHTVPKDYR